MKNGAERGTFFSHVHHHKKQSFKMPNNNSRHLKWYLKGRFSLPKHYMGRETSLLLLLYLNEQVMTFVAHRFHRHQSLMLKCVLQLTADTNSATTISNSFISPIKLKHCFGNMSHASNLSHQILWAQPVLFPAVMNIRSTLTTRQRCWQSPTHSVDLTRVVMRQVRVKTTCDMTRITHGS